LSFVKRPVRSLKFLTGFFICVALLTACENKTTGASISGYTMGTSYHVTVVADISVEETEKLKTKVDNALVGVNQTFSTYIDNSEVSTFNQSKAKDAQEKSDDFMTVLTEALAISKATQGAYDITVGPLVNLWGFGPDFNEDSVPSDDSIQQALLKVGYQHIVLDSDSKRVQKLKDDIYIDFSSIAKGYGVDKVAELLNLNGYENYMVEIGGEMFVRGVNGQGANWRIAVEKPDASTRSIHKVINVTNTAIATSGDYRNFFEKDGVRFSHTIDPISGGPVQQDLVSVTVLAEKSMTADAWATAFMVLGAKKGYDLAIKDQLAVLFLVKEGDSLKERVTPAFQRAIGEKAS